jgi:hypothetical protein
MPQFCQCVKHGYLAFYTLISVIVITCQEEVTLSVPQFCQCIKHGYLTFYTLISVIVITCQEEVTLSVTRNVSPTCF